MRITHPTNRPNFAIVHLEGMEVAFSHETPIAFRGIHDPRWCVRENEWGPTTGKHLNEIDGGDKANRLPSRLFLDLLDEWQQGESPRAVASRNAS